MFWLEFDKSDLQVEKKIEKDKQWSDPDATRT